MKSTNALLAVAILTLAAHFARGMAPPAKITDVSEILARVHATNQLEIKIGQLAKEKGETAAVRAYGDRLVRDHKMADKKALSLAKREGIALREPIPRSDAERTAMAGEKVLPEKLAALSAADFDQAFLKAMHAGHESAIALLEGTDTGDLRVQQFLTRLVPILQQHLQLADHVDHKMASTQ